MKKKAQLARPSNLPGMEMEKHPGLCRPRGRKAKFGPCSKCGTEGRLVMGLCRRCYYHEKYLVRPGVAKRIVEREARHAAQEKKRQEVAERRARRVIKEKEKQLRGDKWRAAHPGWEKYPRKIKSEDHPEKGTPSWVGDWLRHQAENYLRENAGRFDRNGTRLWAMTEEQIIGLCRIIYVAVDRHKKWGRGDETYSRRLEDGGEKTGRGSPGEWDKYEDFVDHSISSSFRHGFSRIREG